MSQPLAAPVLDAGCRGESELAGAALDHDLETVAQRRADPLALDGCPAAVAHPGDQVDAVESRAAAPGPRRARRRGGALRRARRPAAARAVGLTASSASSGRSLFGCSTRHSSPSAARERQRVARPRPARGRRAGSRRGRRGRSPSRLPRRPPARSSRRRGRSTRSTPRARAGASGSRCRGARAAGSRTGPARRARRRRRPSTRRGCRAEPGWAGRDAPARVQLAVEQLLGPPHGVVELRRDRHPAQQSLEPQLVTVAPAVDQERRARGAHAGVVEALEHASPPRARGGPCSCCRRCRTGCGRARTRASPPARSRTRRSGARRGGTSSCR